MKKHMVKDDRKKQLIATGFAAVVGVFVGLLFFAITLTYSFTDKYRVAFQSPIVFQSPFVLESRKPALIWLQPSSTDSAIATPSQDLIKQSGFKSPPKLDAEFASVGKDRQIIHSYENGPILWRLYRKESSAGKNDGCKDDGKFNGFGYGQHERGWLCFDTFEEVVVAVDSWINKHALEFNSEAQLYCYYNLGKIVDDCQYYQDILAL